MEYTDDLTRKKDIAKFLREANTKVKQEEYKLKEQKLAKKKVKLPKIALKSFRWRLLEWLSFWGSFLASERENSDISGVDKMNYLSGLLKGEVARLVLGLPWSESNYNRAVVAPETFWSETSFDKCPCGCFVENSGSNKRYEET